MRCMLCGEEMRLVRAVRDEALLVPGFEHHILSCPSCHDEETRLVFIDQAAPLSPSAATGELKAHPIDVRLRPAATVGAEHEAPREITIVRSEKMLPIESSATGITPFSAAKIPNRRFSERESLGPQSRAASCALGAVVWPPRAAARRQKAGYAHRKLTFPVTNHLRFWRRAAVSGPLHYRGWPSSNLRSRISPSVTYWKPLRRPIGSSLRMSM